MSSFAINTLTLDGNLVSDPELRTLPSGTSVCNLRIAHNEQRKDSSGEYVDHAGFYDVTVRGRPGRVGCREPRQARPDRRQRTAHLPRVRGRAGQEALPGQHHR